MTIDELVRLAREVRDDFTHEAMKHGGLHETSAFQLASAVLDILTVEKPCGWDEGDVVWPLSNGLLCIEDHKHSAALDADEAAWAALTILRAVEKARTP